jgi:hypothetical protein
LETSHITLVLACLLPLTTFAQSATPPVSLNSSGRSAEISIPGLAPFSSGFAANVEINGKGTLLRSEVGKVEAPVNSKEATPFGEAAVTTTTLRFEAEQLDLMLRVGRLPNAPDVLLQAGIRNASGKTIKLHSLMPLIANAAIPVSDWEQKNGRYYLDPEKAIFATQDVKKCLLNQSYSEKPLSIAGKTYEQGLGTHARSELVFQLEGMCDRFHAFVGADDNGGGDMGFEVWSDTIRIFQSGILKKGEAAKEIDISVAGAKTLRLVVTEGPNGIGGAHANWADAYVTLAPKGTIAAKSTSGLSLEGKPSDWVLTRLNGIYNDKKDTFKNACSFDKLTSPVTFREQGSLYRREGVGFLFGPVGDPIAYLRATVTPKGNNRASFQVSSEMSGILVDAGETRWGQQMALFPQKPHDARIRQAEWIAKTHKARTAKGAMHGWCSWYLKTSHITGDEVLGIVDAVKQSPDRLRPAGIQIDDGYQELEGVWDANAKFSQGMPYYAKKIAEVGARPGLWMAITMIAEKAPWVKDPANLEAVWGKSFKPDQGGTRQPVGWLDPTHPKGKDHIADRIRHAVKNGYTYLKLDFNNIGGGGWYEKKRTSFEIMRDHYTNIRQAAGEDTYILFCTESPVRATVGLVDASRTSQDAYRGGVRNSMGQVLRFYDMNNRWFAVDNDVYYMANDVKGAGNIAGGWPMLRTYSSMMGLSSGAALTSDLWQWEGFKAHLRMTEIMTPPAKEQTEVLDLCTAEEWPRLVSHVGRPWGKWTVALLWNPENNDTTVSLDFAKAGLHPNQPYAVWSFWDSKFLGIAKGQWTTPSLPPGGNQHLCLTDLDALPSKPVVIGSDLHIFCGAAELKAVETSSNGISITLTDAGAREGNVFLYSTRPLAAKSASGCEVKSVEAAGENVWKVNIANRKTDKTQSFELKMN